ncbi:PKD domain-containing protein [Brumimicrobium glaciale]|uniref:PKD domain-containing protein n=1 Tax=Brumimicrobium glaciale TaxID=200475 RepID=A0A4Q4KJW2_9FLAO|nr:PKD domain-containing protein [Brumimicrobium glaciale]RYM33581.1 PKD domain-containing protein [Brumimicrobium glaciale]
MRILLTLITVFIFANHLFAQPTTDFTAAPLEICVGENVQFTDLSTSSSAITSWTWDFGDGSTSSNQNPSHTYTNSGLFTVILTAVNANGASPEVKINYITVNPLPNPSFTPSVIGGCSLPSVVSINNVLPNSGVTYLWDFGNGTTSTSGTPANITYNSEGVYSITLTVTNTTTGCVNTVVETINIFDYTTDFSIPSVTGCVGSPVNFVDASSPGTDSWNWNFGNGSSSIDQNPFNIYTAVGTYTVTLTTTNSVNGCTDTHSETIEIFQAPTPSFTFNPNSGCAPLDVTFTNTSSGIGTFNWSYGDGGSFSGENPPPYPYTSNGVYSVTLTQTDVNGCSSATTQSNIINVSSIIAEFEPDIDKGCETLNVNFTDLSSSPNASDPITSWLWDFGNGTTFNGQTPPTQAFTEGVYDVSLTVTTNAGCSQTEVKVDTIAVGIIPNADFSWTPPQDCAKSNFTFTNLTTVPVPTNFGDFTYAWDFGDGGTSSVENPGYQYPLDTGNFDVQLIVNFRGCPDTVTYQDAVYVIAPIASFGVLSIHCNPTLPLDVTFSDQAIIGEITDNAEMKWNWGDGTSTTVTPPGLYANNPGQVTHTYNNLGSYNIKQVVHNYTTGCSDSITRTIHLSSIEAMFQVSNDSVCVNDQVTFTNNGTNSTHGITNSKYNIDNDTIINNANINYIYDTPGTSTITFTVTNVFGCQDSQVFTDLEVLALPEANILASDIAGCSPLTVTYTNNSVNQSGVPISTFDWTFEDGSTQTTTNLNQTTDYTFTDTGTFITQLLVTDEFGCVSSIDTAAIELTKPTALFDVAAVVCSDQEFTAVNNSLDFTSSEWFINNTPESTDSNLITSINHLSSPNDLSFADSITLVVTDANGCIDSIKQEIIVSTPNAEFDFVFSGANINDQGSFVCPPVFTDLTDLSGSYGNITNWNWDFSDGKTSTLQSPNNTYVFAGTYSGTLVITDEYGCSDSIVYVDYLTIGGPSGDLEWALNNQCEQEYTFTPSNLQGVTDILWVMGNGDTISSIDAFNYAYTGAGSYVPTATIMNDDNCNITYILDTIKVTITPLNPYFEINPMSMNWGEPATITDFSTGGYGGIVNWFWEIEGGESFNNNGEAYDYLFNTTGDITVQLTVTDSAGCKDTFEVVVNVIDNLTIPNILTPNGDGINDVFRLIDNVYKDYKVIILNRWGNLVSESFIIEGNYLWDGLNRNGKECTEGVYFYKIDGNQRNGEPRTEHGFVHLVRQ